MKKKIVISGFLGFEEDGNNVTIYEDKEKSWADDILIEIIEDSIRPSILSALDEYNEELGGTSYYIPNCNISFYISDNKLLLEDVSEKYTMQLLGSIDVFGENYGYSEWTIIGFNTQKFTIGNHNLNEILRSYKDKYINLIIEY